MLKSTNPVFTYCVNKEKNREGGNKQGFNAVSSLSPN
jgi:hypothetical protein